MFAKHSIFHLPCISFASHSLCYERRGKEKKCNWSLANLGSCLAVIQKRSSMLIAEYLNFSDKFNQILSEEKLLIQ